VISIETVIGRLLEATRGDREIDYMIALVMGWKRVDRPAADNKTADQKRVLWLVPNGKEESKVPTYTSNLQDAYSLALQIGPRRVAGCSWEPGKASAAFEGEAPVQAATPILALCAACMELKRREYQ
jgi:hypothetical protein